MQSSKQLKSTPLEIIYVAQTVKNLPAIRDTWVSSLGWEDIREQSMTTQSSILAWRIPMDRGAWWATAHEVANSRTWLNTAYIYIYIYMPYIHIFSVCYICLYYRFYFFLFCIIVSNLHLFHYATLWCFWGMQLCSYLNML